jgi:hypothetical protein
MLSDLLVRGEIRLTAGAGAAADATPIDVIDARLFACIAPLGTMGGSCFLEPLQLVQDLECTVDDLVTVTCFFFRGVRLRR